MSSRIIIIPTITLILGLILGYAFFGGKEDTKEHSHKTERSGESKKETTYTCSMHPQIRQKEPGDCPICGMDLIPVDEASSTSKTVLEMSHAATKLAEIQTTPVKKQDPEKTVRMQGKVEVDERKISLITARYPGRIEKLHVDFTGQRVRKGKKLASIYSPELIAAQKELFEAIQYKDDQPELYQAARNKLKLWDLSKEQIDAIEERGKPKEVIDILAPHSGIVTERKVTLGEYVKEGSSLFKVADLSKVWVVFDAYEMDIPWLDKGDEVEFTVSGFPGKTFKSRITFIHPVMNSKTRTVGIRTEARNPNGKLRPEMFATGTVDARLPLEEPKLTVPKSAVMWTGKRSVVYVKVPNTEKPTFEFREVTLGNDLGKAFIVDEGLEEGEKVVTHGTFKVDAAAQLAGKKSMMNRSMEKEEEKELKTFQADPGFKKKLTALVRSYFDLKNAFVNSNPQKAKAAAERSMNKLKEIPMKGMSEEAHKAWMERKNEIQKGLEKIGNTEKLKEQRNAFVGLSTGLSDAVQQFGVQGIKVYKDFCPMANNDKGAYWLSEIEAIKNPYYGEQMMSCGKVDTIFE